jgi:hypothetical protein
MAGLGAAGRRLAPRGRGVAKVDLAQLVAESAILELGPHQPARRGIGCWHAGPGPGAGSERPGSSRWVPGGLLRWGSGAAARRWAAIAAHLFFTPVDALPPPPQTKMVLPSGQAAP